MRQLKALLVGAAMLSVVTSANAAPFESGQLTIALGTLPGLKVTVSAVASATPPTTETVRPGSVPRAIVS